MKINTIIIGSGISGLTIAAGLETHDFLILEARDRIGGRVLTHPDTHLDMGAAWIHGSINNPLNKFLDRNKMIPISTSNPWMHSADTLIKYLNTTGEISEPDRQQLIHKWRNLIIQIAAISNKTIMEAFTQLSPDADMKSFLYMMEVWCGGSLDNIPTSFLTNSLDGLFGDYSGEHCLFTNGATSLVDAIVASSNHNILERIQYNKVVTDIIYGQNVVEIVVADGSKYYCDKLCITVPPGPLLNIRFSPPLSQERMNAISQIKMGAYKKIQLEFDSVFWNDAPMILTYNPVLIIDERRIEYILWNNYMYSKNKPILEAICPANIGWALSGKPDEEIVDQIMMNLRTFYPLAPDPVA